MVEGGGGRGVERTVPFARDTHGLEDAVCWGYPFGDGSMTSSWFCVVLILCFVLVVLHTLQRHLSMPWHDLDILDCRRVI